VAWGAVADPSKPSVVRSASLWESAIKASIGKLDLPKDCFSNAIPKAGYEVLSTRLAHLNVCRILPRHHRDAFDRILVPSGRASAFSVIFRHPAIARYDMEVLACERAGELVNPGACPPTGSRGIGRPGEVRRRRYALENRALR
jgi:PIN domain nuclease of toxin-antitoxin system